MGTGRRRHGGARGVGPIQWEERGRSGSRGGEWVAARVRPSGERGVMQGASGLAWGPDGLLGRGPVGGGALFLFLLVLFSVFFNN